MRKLFSMFVAIVAFSVVGALARAAGAVQQWGLYETSLSGPAEGNPFVDVQFSAEFTQGKQTVKVPGFYDGEGTYRLRFSPPSQGEWTYVTHSNVAALEGKSGAVTVSPPTGDNHGQVKVFNTFHFAYADGTPYFECGTTCYAWTHQPDELEEQTLKTLSTSPFNKIRMCIFPKSYTFNTNDPVNYPFVKTGEGKFDFARFDPANWRHFEQRVGDLEKLGIQADLILFHPYDRWGFSEMDAASDDRYLRYAIARLSAYRNVWWSLANEYDFMIPPLRKGQRGNKTVADFDRFFSILEKEDPYAHLRGIHHASKMYDHGKEWVTHASVQNSDPTKILGLREKFHKPVVYDECRYEGNIPNSWGKLTGPEMVRQFWLGTMSGGYVGHGETLLDPHDVLWWSKGGVLHGESPARIAYLRKLMEALPFWEMTPSRGDPNVLVLEKAGVVTLAYALKAGPMEVKLAGTGSYTVEAIDTWAMKSEAVGTATGGVYKTTAPRGDYLLRILPAK